MTTKVVKIVLSSILFISILSCESDLDQVGVNIVDYDVFNKGTHQSEVVTYNQNILKRKANSLGRYLLGTYKNEEFGKIDASIVTQLSPSTDIDFGDNPSIDSVVLHIPYLATRLDDNTDGTPNFELDSLLGNSEIAYNLNVYELNSYLNTLNPDNPSKALDYYTDQTYDYNPIALYSGLFKPNKNDTVMYINRPEVINNVVAKLYNVDTLKMTDLSPSIKLSLNEDFFTNNFLNNSAAFESPAAFLDLFKGLYIEATETTDGSASLLQLSLESANVTIYYTNTVLKNETTVDLNGDGDTDDVDVSLRTGQTAILNFSGITANTIVRNYAGSKAESIIDNPDTTLGDQQLYLQGAAGSIALIDLFTNEDIQTLRNNSWLINEANIVFYVDQSTDTSIAPERLFLYDFNQNIQLSDMIYEGSTAFDGNLERDSSGNPLKYKINITNYISNILKKKDPLALSKLALKVYNTSDTPTETNPLEILDYSWNPKGVVLHGNKSTDIDKRIKLEIIYTQIN